MSSRPVLALALGLFAAAGMRGQDGSWNPVAFPPTAPVPPASAIPPVPAVPPGDGSGSGGEQGVAPVTRRMVLQRVRTEGFFGLDGFDCFTGEGEEAKLAGFVVKSVLGDQFNFKDSRESSTTKAIFKKRRGGVWVFTADDGTGDRRAPPILELRPREAGFDSYNRAGQLFARCRFETRAEAGGRRAVQRVYYSSDGPLPGWSALAARVNDSPALEIRRSAGAAAQPAYTVVFQDWARAPGPPPERDAIGFDDLAGGPRGGAAAGADDEAYLRGAGIFLDAWVLSRAWRTTVAMPHAGE